MRNAISSLTLTALIATLFSLSACQGRHESQGRQVGKKIDEFEHGVKDQLQRGKETVHNALEQGKETAHNAKDKIEKKTHSAVESAKQKAHEAIN